MIAFITILSVCLYIVTGTAVGVARYRWVGKHWSFRPVDYDITASFEGAIWPITLLLALGWKIGKEISKRF